MRRFIALLIFLVLVTASLIGGAGNGPSVHASGPDNDFVPSEVVVKLTSTADLPGVSATFGLDPTPLDQFGTRPIYRLHITDLNANVQDKVTALLNDPQKRVIYAEPNFIALPPEGGGQFLECRATRGASVVMPGLTSRNGRRKKSIYPPHSEFHEARA